MEILQTYSIEEAVSFYKSIDYDESIIIISS